MSLAAKQAGEARADQWSWVEREVWTERMLETLEKGVKGGVWYSLIDKVYRLRTLELAWKQVRRNQGRAGSDGQTIAKFEARLKENLLKLQQELETQTYRPRPILRTYIKKTGSTEQRPLGIPAVRDRVVQAALRIVIEPIFEHVFMPHSHGFRPKRGCKDALREVDGLLKSGFEWVVDADLRKYFDTIPHAGLLQEVERFISDSRVLDLIRSFLEQGVLEDSKVWQPEEGTPQGAVISPLLANLYMHPIDVAMVQAGFRMVRYADDFVIMCRTREQAEAALETVRQLVAARGLSLHPEKTRLVDMREPGAGFDFLGYHFSWSKRKERFIRWPRKKSLDKFKDTVRRKTRRCNGHSMPRIIEDVNVTLKGWFEYYKHSNPYTFHRLDPWIRRRLRSILRKRSGRRGISRGRDHNRWPNKYFQELGLFSLVMAHASCLQSS